MDDGMKNIDTIFNDTTTTFPTSDQLKQVFDFAIDIVYKNADKCQLYQVVSQSMMWCTENVGLCVYNENIMSRLQAAAPLMLMKGMEIFNIIRSDVYNDDDKMI